MIEARDATADLESFVEAFECARVEAQGARVEDFLPPREHRQYFEIVAELLRIDLELGWRRGVPAPVEHYCRRFADVLSEPDHLAGLAFEEYRLRCQAGHDVSPAEYGRRFKIDTSDWPPPDSSKDSGVACEAAPASGDSEFPSVGQSIAEFDLIELLGRGAFGRVYLARQRGLANRPVALKITSHSSVEPGRLAQLQHTNIVPIYSVHQADRFEAICMPFLGRNTLADVVEATRRQGRLPKSGQELLTTVVTGREPTVDRNGKLPRGLSDLDGKQQAATIALAPSIRAQLERATYVDAVVWIMAKLAAGVAHAHERGILHRDLKPANVLLADDGRPMLLDFNLSDRIASGSGRAAAIGGTLPYMAPEHLEALETGVGIDGRSDIYSLGVIMFELLAGRLPFETSASATPSAIAAQIAERRRGAPAVRQFNREAPHSIAAVTAKCLAPLSDDRYQSAEELRVDLERQLENLPLLHVADRSPGERIRKWVRRHPRLSSASSITAFASVLLIVGAIAWCVRDRQFAETRAHVLYTEFLPELAKARLPLSVPTPHPELVQAAVLATQAQLSRYGIEPEPTTAWHERAEYALLPASEKSKLDQEVQKSLQLVSAANQQGLRQPAPQTALAADEELAAHELLRRGKAAAALAILTKWRDASPMNLSALVLLSDAHLKMGSPADAEECLTTCIAQEPKYAFSYFQRGLARLEQRKYHDAANDFSTYMTLGGQRVPALVNRAIARNKAKDLNGSLADIDAVLAAGTKQTRVYFIRADINRKLGNDAAANKDLATGLRLVPQDALSFLARGVARLKTDADGALKDFRQALTLDPSSRTAKQNIVHVLGDRLGHEQEALAVLDSILDSDPRDARALAGRAVLKARRGEREAALADAVAACDLDGDPTIILQAACAFARSADEFPGDKTRALHLMGRSLAANPELARIAASDPDLKPLRSSEEFGRILDAANVILNGGASPSLNTSTSK
jgi:serine/threonine protein kinase/tetratricopeptide (TPR) repeat protein